MPSRTGPVQNFGGNLSLAPHCTFEPRNEAELLQILRDNLGRQIRATGALHSWSEAALVDEIRISLKHLNQVEVRERDGQPIAVIGAGCQIKRALAELDKHGLTLPALGLISEQTLAGATATATHGTGRHCTSHYLTAVRLACYDASGEPVIREIREGAALQAAQCSLGCLGIIVALELRPRERYQVEEWLALHTTLDEVLAAETDAPLQQFYYLPWLEKFLGQHRRDTNRPRSWLAPVYRAYWFVTIDVALHFIIRLLVQRLRSAWFLKFFFRWIALCTLIRGWHVVDRSQDMLVMEHELFRHIEIELFVQRSKLSAAIEFVRAAIARFAGEAADLPAPMEIDQTAAQLPEWPTSGTATYTHHYPVCIRRVLPDQTLLSMTSGGDEDYYAISLISYELPEQRAGFLAFADFLAHQMAALFGARCHWGKVCPLTAGEVETLYPRLGNFRKVQAEFDPQGVFSNSWTRDLLKLAAKSG